MTASMGIKALVANTPEPTLGERLGLYQTAAAAHGRALQLGEATAIGYRFFIADTQQKRRHATFHGPVDRLVSPARSRQEMPPRCQTP